MVMTIRLATVWDAEKVTNLWLAMHEEITANKALLLENGNRETLFLNLVTRVKLPEWHILVAEEGGEIYGFIMATACFPRYNPCHVLGVCEALYVDPTRRGDGLFLKLILSMLEWAKTKNVTEVEFYGAYGSRITKLYERMGYVPVMMIYRQKEA